MQRNRTIPWAPLTAVLAFAIAAAVLAPVWPVAWALRSPDSPPFYGNAWKTSFFNGLIDPRVQSFSHDTLLALALPPLVYHDVSYMLSTALLALAVAVYLRGLRLPPLPCVAGGLAMAFSGYQFSLFNAGHRGYFIMMPYAVFLFALIDRATLAPRVAQFVLMAVCVAYGIGHQPDVLVLFLGVAALYAVLRAVQALRAGDAPRRRTLARKWGVGLVVAAAVLAIAGANLVHTLTQALAIRDKQLAQTERAASERPDGLQDPGIQDPGIQEENRRNAWIFATNWSLPPEAMLEFVAPSVRGYDSYNPAGPYWGTLGQTFGWPKERQGFVNYRQHSLYLGVLQLLLALFAVGCIVRPTAQSPGDGGAGERTFPLSLRAVVGFWAAIAVFSLLLALGRHTPLYRLFYALPGMSRLRAPVKFLHITELSLAVLSAIGLAGLLSLAQDRRRVLRPVAVFCAVLAAVGALACLFAALLAPTEGGVLAERLAAMNLAAHEDRLRALYTAALLRGAVLFAIGGALFGGAAFLPTPGAGVLRGATALGVALLALDLATAARPYVNPMDMRPYLARNPIADALLAAGGPDGMGVGNRLAAMHSQEPLLWTFSREGIVQPDPPVNAGPDSATVESLRHFQQDARKQWMFWGTRAVLVPPAAMPQFTRDREFAAMGSFAFSGVHLIPVPPEQAQVGVVAFRSWIPTAALYSRWRAVPPGDVWPTLADPAFDLSQEVVVTDAPACPPGAPAGAAKAARLVLPPSRGGRRKAVVEVESDHPGMLVLRDRIGGVPRVWATVNGQRRPALSANRFFWAVPVEAGVSRVVFQAELAWWRLGLHAAGVLLALLAIWRECRAAVR